MVIVWSKTAREDLRLIHQYIAYNSKHYATRVVQDITTKVGVLLDFPHICKVVSEISEENVRELSMYSYRIMYEIVGDVIHIHGVIHKQRHFDPEHLPRALT